jgi:protocatechuate 3,4-dioxygenase beta subunit
MLLKTGPFFLGSFALAACRQRLTGSTLQSQEQPALTQNLSPTPACGDDPTPSQTAGPFYTPNSPERTSLLEADTVGTPIVLTGQVLSTRCTPIAGALIDFWHTNAEGAYDNSGYTFRGHQFTDEEGRYQLETIAPGIYPGRTRHIHVRVQQPRQSPLTTQLYFPNEPLNEEDFLYRPELLVSMDNGGIDRSSPKENRLQAQFNFVLASES